LQAAMLKALPPLVKLWQAVTMLAELVEALHMAVVNPAQLADD
jgi:hypothetical protein